MKCGRGRIIALTVLSIAMALALFCTGYIVDLRSFTSRAVDNELFVDNPNYIPTFDDLYERVPFNAIDTGSVTLGQTTNLTLLEERYSRGTLTEFLNTSSKRSYRELQKSRNEGYPRPIFEASEMRTIAMGKGLANDIPVVMLDPYNYDDIVLFELTNLVDVPTNLSITRDGVSLDDLICTVDATLTDDQVYAGVPDRSLVGMSSMLSDADGNDVLSVVFKPSTKVAAGYIVEIKDLESNFYYRINETTMQLEEIRTIENGDTDLYNENGVLVYRVERNDNEVKVYVRNTNELLGVVTYKEEENQLINYEIGAIAYNGNALRGMFQEQGFYQITFRQKIPTGDGILTEIDVSFAFVIVNKINYMDFPRFDTKNRVRGKSEIYNYSYEGDFPVVEYSSYYFDVQIQTTEKYGQNDPTYGERELRFYNIGEYQMVSKLQCYNAYLAGRDQEFNNRGVNKGFISLKRYLPYSSVLNILGFQAYYGGQHSDKQFNGPLPFYDEEDINKSSDISTVVRSAGMLASNIGFDVTSMTESDALNYSNQLASYLTSKGIKPVKTNFPPVKMYGNVPHATGPGVNGEAAVVLSSVAYKAAYGKNANEWQSSLIEVGAPFEAAGQYVVTTYFKVNNQICQQIFFFEIVNSVNIVFDVTDALGNTKTHYAGELELNHVEGNKVAISYDGDHKLGQFEVPPTITLSYAPFGELVFVEQSIPVQEGGAFNFNLNPGQYRLTVKYGAHSKSATIFSIIVDDTLATGIKANTTAKSLTGLPENIAVVGAGKVNLTWNHKISGVNFTNVLYEFYEINLENVGMDPNDDRNYFTATNETYLGRISNLYSAYAFSEIASKPNNGFVPVKTNDCWMIEESFESAGLHRFTLIDDVGNETEFILIIDDSTPTFVQSGNKPGINSNVVNFDSDIGVYVGFGRKKLIAGQKMFNDLGNEIKNNFTNANVLTVDSRYTMGVYRNITSLGIGIARVEYSVSGDLYQDISNEDFKNGYVLLKQEGTYFFRVTDALGNVGEYYIMITHDGCLGRVYAERSRPKISTENNHSGRGFTTEEPEIYTSLVTSSGGMTNRPFVTFSFEQKDYNEPFCVEKVYLQYYPMTYQTMSSIDQTEPNPNYPFSDKQLNNPIEKGIHVFAHQDNEDGLIYTYEDSDADNTIRLVLFNNSTTTPSGMYIITRVYQSQQDEDPLARDYYFIVDNQKMLYYAEGDNPYQTTMKIDFANAQNDPKAKKADAKYFYQNNNEINSDRTAWVTGFKSKYSYKHDSTVYTFEKDKKNFNFIADSLTPSITSCNFVFPSVTPRFSYIYNNQTVNLGAGDGVWCVGDPATHGDSSVYKLVIADDARNISCVLTNGNITELKDDESAPTSANYDYLLLNLDLGRGAKAEIQISEDKIITNSKMQYDGQNYFYVIDPMEIEQLKFSFVSDPESMFVDVNLAETTSSWTSDGFMQPVSFRIPTPVDNRYTFDILNEYLSGRVIENGASLSVTLKTEDSAVTKYMILFDTEKPNYNLNHIKDGDNLACEMMDSELPGDYVYGLSNTYVFASEQGSNRYLDTKTITYREVDYSGDGTQSAVPFKLYTGAENEKPVPFATLVGLHDNEMKYFIITEIDYTGHTVDYMVQVQGDNYVNNISFIGAITDESAEVQIGSEMHASESSVHQFFLNNNSFKFVNGDDYYSVLGSTATWHIGNDIGTGAKSEANLIKALNNWINIATESGTKCSYTLYDRIGEKEVFEFYNIRENAAQIQLDCYQAGASSTVIMTSVTNYDNLPKILFEEGLSSLFKMTVQDITTPEVSSEVYFSLQGTAIQGFDVSHDLIITVTDPFGRVSITEYHQQTKSTINFKVYGNTVNQDNIIYLGDERGVDFSYLRTAYSVLIYNAGTGELLTDLQSFISNDMISYHFVPTKGATTIEQYRIVATGRASGAILFDQTFVFDTRLPIVDWKNASDQSIDVEGQTFVSDVCLDITNSLVATTFPVTISYTRTFDDKIEYVTLKPGTTKYTFKQPGKYVVTLRNIVWAKKVIEFEIAQIDDTLVLVYDDGDQVDASLSDYKFTPNKMNPEEYIYIPRYIFTTSNNGNLITEYQSHGLDIRVGQTNRVLAGDFDANTDYYYFDNKNNTLVWRLAFLLGVDKDGKAIYDNPIYFATTGVPEGELNNSPISLQLNGNPNVSGTGNMNYVVPAAQTTYHIIDDSFMKANNNKLEVRLSCGRDVLRDENGLPYYMVVGNVIVVDCYYNGTLVKTLYGDAASEVFTIGRYDAGYYEFVVHDLVGNYLYFGYSDNENDIAYKQNRYMLMVMTKPMVLINEKQPVNGMIYNDEVQLKLVDYGNQFLSKLHANDLAKDKDFFTKRFCISKIEGTYTGANGTVPIEMNVNGMQSSFYWNQSGTYRIKVTYRISDNVLEDLQAEYQFQIIPSHTIRESFSMSIYPDVQVESVTRDGYKIHDFDDVKVNDYMEFNADSNPGSYVVTLKTYNTILQDYVLHEVKFNIQHKANSASNYFVLSSGSGTETTNAVTLYYNPYWLYYSQGKVTIILYKNFVEQQKVVVDHNVLNSENFNPQALFTVSDAGLYSVVVKDSDEDPVYMDSWTIKQKESTFGYVILSVVLGIAGVAVLIFLRMRNKMTTK